MRVEFPTTCALVTMYPSESRITPEPAPRSVLTRPGALSWLRSPPPRPCAFTCTTAGLNCSTSRCSDWLNQRSEGCCVLWAETVSVKRRQMKNFVAIGMLGRARQMLQTISYGDAAHRWAVYFTLVGPDESEASGMAVSSGSNAASPEICKTRSKSTIIEPLTGDPSEANGGSLSGRDQHAGACLYGERGSNDR